jgi:hypothetical protein
MKTIDCKLDCGNCATAKLLGNDCCQKYQERKVTRLWPSLSPWVSVAVDFVYYLAIVIAAAWATGATQ